MSRPRHIANRILIPITGYTGKDVSSEAVTVPAGAAGTVVDFYLSEKPISDSNSSYIGANGNTSVVLTGATFTTEVAPRDDADLSNGEYWVDYLTGRCRGKKADTGVSITADYTVFQAV